MPLQDSDNFIIGRGTDSYKITYQDLKDDLNYVPPPPPIVVGKGVITPSVDVETGDTLTGSATVEDAVNPVETHVWELDGVEDQRGSSATYTAKEGEVRYRKEVTDDNNDTPTIGEWSEPVTVTTPPGPTATMSGLRFDSARRTNLSKSFNFSSSHTISFWVKQTSLSNVVDYFLVGDGSNYIGVTPGNLVYANGTTSEVSYTPTINKWTHYVFSKSSDKIEFFVDGSKVGSLENTNNFPSNLNWEIGGKDGGGNGDFGGYSSDYYFVDGKAAPPTTFGKYFEGGKWGPLDSSVVQDNLSNLQPADPEQPYDDRANTSKVWSNGVTSNQTFFPTNPATAAFNGRDSGAGSAAETSVGGSSSYILVSSLGFTGTDTVRIKGLWTQIEINGVEQNTGLVNNVYYEFRDIQNLDTIKIYGSDADPLASPTLYQIEVSGRALVDQGVWNNSQNWSGNASGGRSNSNPANAFDSNLSTGYTIDGAEFFKVTFDTPLSGNFQIAGIIASPGSNPVLVAFNDGSENSYNLGGESFPASFTDLGNQTSVSKITVRATGSSWNLAAFKLDDAILVDSGAQWNTDQVWSGNTEGPMSPTNGAVYAFDGDLTTRAYTDGSPVPNEATFNFNPPVSVNSKLAVYVGTGGNGVFAPLKVNGTDVSSQLPASGSSSGEWVTLTGISSLSSISISRTEPATYVSLSAVKVDGALLVDGAYTWNSSQVWSDGVTSDGGWTSSPTRMFDGNLATNAQAASGGGTAAIRIPGPFTGVTSLVLYGRSEGTGTDSYSVSGNGFTAVSDWANNGAQRLELTLTDTTVSDIVITTVPNTGLRMSGVELNGALLVDPGFGGNGFYLPFDPAQTGANYSSKLTTNGSWNPGVGPENAFNGDTDPGSRAETSDGTVVTLDLSSNPVAIGSSLKVMTGSNGAAGGTMTLNGNANTAVSITNSYTEYTVPLDSETQLSTLTFNSTTGSFVVYVKVDDSVLVDHTSIGVDMSGNNNNFHDQNFGVGDSSQIWSNGLDNPAGFDTNNPVRNAFDGSISTWARTNSDTVPGTVTFPVVSGSSFVIYGSPDNTPGAVIKVRNQGTTWIDITDRFAQDATIQRVDITDTGITGITGFEIIGAPSNPRIAGIEVDGEMLIDPSFVDTVLDTPMKNYAVLETGTNGNLTATSSTNTTVTTVEVSGGQKIYAEFSIIGTGTADNDYSLGVSKSDKSNMDNIAGNGDVTKAALAAGNAGFTYGSGDVIGMAWDVDNKTIEYFKNDASVYTLTEVSADNLYFRIGRNSTGDEIVACNFGQQPFVHTPPVGYEGLYQEWIEYARSALGYAQDRIAQLEQRNIFLEGLIANAQERLAALELNEISDDAVDTALITLIGNINDRLTALEAGN